MKNREPCPFRILFFFIAIAYAIAYLIHGKDDDDENL